jgi:hypothetical protein
MRGREDSDIRFAFHEYIAGGAEAFVDRVHAVDQAGHGTRVDIFGELLALLNQALVRGSRNGAISGRSSACSMGRRPWSLLTFWSSGE